LLFKWRAHNEQWTDGKEGGGERAGGAGGEFVADRLICSSSGGHTMNNGRTGKKEVEKVLKEQEGNIKMSEKVDVGGEAGVLCIPYFELNGGKCAHII
jgi:hypothetical protein